MSDRFCYVVDGNIYLGIQIIHNDSIGTLLSSAKPFTSEYVNYVHMKDVNILKEVDSTYSMKNLKEDYPEYFI